MPGSPGTIIEPLLDVPAVASILNVAPHAVYRLVEGGGLPHVKIGVRVRIRPDDLAAFIDKRLQGAEA